MALAVLWGPVFPHMYAGEHLDTFANDRLRSSAQCTCSTHLGIYFCSAHFAFPYVNIQHSLSRAFMDVFLGWE